MNVHITTHGENLFNVAEKYNVDIKALLVANPHVQNPTRMKGGIEITIPAVPKQPELFGCGIHSKTLGGVKKPCGCKVGSTNCGCSTSTLGPYSTPNSGYNIPSNQVYLESPSVTNEVLQSPSPSNQTYLESPDTNQQTMQSQMIGTWNNQMNPVAYQPYSSGGYGQNNFPYTQYPTQYPQQIHPMYNAYPRYQWYHPYTRKG
jgi:LysM repeat protein